MLGTPFDLCVTFPVITGSVPLESIVQQNLRLCPFRVGLHTLQLSNDILSQLKVLGHYWRFSGVPMVARCHMFTGSFCFASYV